MSIFQDVAVVAKCFWAFILPVLEYCSPVWMSSATSHLLLLVHVVGRVRQLSIGSVSYDLWHRVKVASLCVFFKIDSLIDHPVHGLFPVLHYVLRRPIHGALVLTLDILRCQGLELVSFHDLLFCLVFDCGTGCMNLSLLVKIWVLLKLQSIAFYYKTDYQLFYPAVLLFLFHIFFLPDLREYVRPLDLYALGLYSSCFGLVFLYRGSFSR